VIRNKGRGGCHRGRPRRRSWGTTANGGGHGRAAGRDPRPGEGDEREDVARVATPPRRGPPPRLSFRLTLNLARPTQPGRQRYFRCASLARHVAKKAKRNRRRARARYFRPVSPPARCPAGPHSRPRVDGRSRSRRRHAGARRAVASWPRALFYSAAAALCGWLAGWLACPPLFCCVPHRTPPREKRGKYPASSAAARSSRGGESGRRRHRRPAAPEID
jgi:hypothetical protein